MFSLLDTPAGRFGFLVGSLSGFFLVVLPSTRVRNQRKGTS